MKVIHWDEAREGAVLAVRRWLGAAPQVRQATLVADLFGRLRVLVSEDGSTDVSGLSEALRAASGEWWTGETLWLARLDESTRSAYDHALGGAEIDAVEARLSVLGRYRTRNAWFADMAAPVWEATSDAPAVVVFYSFKGGLGRSTSLASFAVQRAQAGDRVCVMDFDLDSPGIGGLLAADQAGRTARWGVVDLVLEQGVIDAPLSDYFHRCDRVAGAGELIVFPAGNVDAALAEKIARLDLERETSADTAGLGGILNRIRAELRPQWILLDARTGLSETAGVLLSGLAHLHVLLGVPQEQSWEGVIRILERLGAHRILRDQPQGDVVLVQAMVPGGDAGRVAREKFSSRAETEFGNRYYAESNPADAGLGDDWDTSDIDSWDAPHVSVALEYDSRLAAFADIADVAALLSADAYAELHARIVGRFVPEEE